MVSEQQRQTSMEATRIESLANLGAPFTAATAPATAIPVVPVPAMVSASSSTASMAAPISATLARIPLKLDRENYSFWCY